MQTISGIQAGGERPFFAISDTKLSDVTILPGESAFKHGKNLSAEHCRFEGKYPFWHCEATTVRDSLFTAGGRAAVWYVKDFTMEKTRVEAPKMFRDSEKVTLKNVTFTDAKETFWTCRGVRLTDCVTDGGDTMYMHSADIELINCRHSGNYAFQWCRDVAIRNCVINCKDAFWNSENVTVYDSEINGEYLGWYTTNLRLINCRISGTQPLYYCQNLVLENCVLAPDCDLAFEYSDVHASLTAPVTSIRNPVSGCITAPAVGEIIYDAYARTPQRCTITTGNA